MSLVQVEVVDAHSDAVVVAVEHPAAPRAAPDTVAYRVGCGADVDEAVDVGQAGSTSAVTK